MSVTLAGPAAGPAGPRARRRRAPGRRPGRVRGLPRPSGGVGRDRTFGRSGASTDGSPRGGTASRRRDQPHALAPPSWRRNSWLPLPSELATGPDGRPGPRARAAGLRPGTGGRDRIADGHRRGRGGHREDHIARRVRPSGTRRGRGRGALRAMPDGPARRWSRSGRCSSTSSNTLRPTCCGPTQPLRRAPGPDAPRLADRSNCRGYGHRRRDGTSSAVRRRRRRAVETGRDESGRGAARRPAMGRADGVGVAPPPGSSSSTPRCCWSSAFATPINRGSSELRAALADLERRPGRRIAFVV